MGFGKDISSSTIEPTKHRTTLKGSLPREIRYAFSILPLKSWCDTYRNSLNQGVNINCFIDAVNAAIKNDQLELDSFETKVWDYQCT
jgi:hypothetical protein